MEVSSVIGRTVMIDRIWHLVNRPESDESEDTPLLSSIVDATGGYLPPSEWQTLLQYAQDLQSQEDKTPSQQAWLVDFLANIAIVKLKEADMDRLVEGRTMRPTSSATFKPAGASEEKSGVERTNTVPGWDGPPREEPMFLQPTRFAESRQVSPQRRPLPEPRAPTIKLNELAHKPTKFDGKNEEAFRWLKDYKQAALDNPWSDRLRVKYMSAFLEKSARDWFAAILRRTSATTWDVARGRVFAAVDSDKIKVRALGSKAIRLQISLRMPSRAIRT